MLKNKKADGGLTAVVIIVLVMVFIGWLAKLNGRECSKDSDCGSERYCGSDFSCHKIPIIEKTTTNVEYNLAFPALIIGIAIIIAALIFNWGKLKNSRKKSEQQDSHLYYTSQKESAEGQH